MKLIAVLPLVAGLISAVVAQNCSFQNGRYVCESSGAITSAPAAQVPAGATTIVEVPSVPSSTSASIPPSPSPVAGQHCHLHGDHWDCHSDEGEEAGHDHDHSEEGHSHAGHDHSGHSHAGHDHSGHSHAGHSHGPSEEYGCGLAPLEEYNMGLHVAALFILLITSIIAVALPHVAKFLTRQSSAAQSGGGVTSWLFFGMRYFGGGIIISTAFIHLLFHAFVYYNNSCIGELKYEAVVAAIAMGAAYLVFLIDFFVLRPLRRKVLLSSQRSSMPSSEAHLHSNDGKINEVESQDSGRAEGQEDHADTTSLNHSESSLLKWNVVMLEAGIVFHSVIIGVTIGTASGEGWVPLLIAIVFHQFCEGLSLSSRIALLAHNAAGNFFKIVSHTFFVLSTPLGVAIGIGVRQSFNGNNRDTLLAIGTLDAISAGILLYSGFVQIIVGDFLNNAGLLRASTGKSVAAVALFTAGIFIMSVLGYWA
ncbi:unnamed protein product [Sympodiomycopsis kandeliae]